MRLEQIEEQVQNLRILEHECESETQMTWSVDDQRSVDDKSVYDFWERESVISDGRYTTLIPMMKLQKNNNMLQAYEENIEKLMSDDHAELVPESFMNRFDGRVRCLPHDVVVNPSKSGKVRIGFDWAAKHGGMSLKSECYQGHFYVTQGRASVKRCGCIFTWLIMCAIHLVVLTMLETDSFLNGFLRCCSRRGYPKSVFSDRGTNLVDAQAEMSTELKKLDYGNLTRFARRYEVEWSFNTPTASHHGGAWERMIRTVRKVLMAIMPQRSISDEVLATVFSEAENLVNSRPLTKLTTDKDDDEPLTPNHLLLHLSNHPPVWRHFLDGEVLRKRWTHVQNLASTFWKRWTKEYLPDLQRRCKWNNVTVDYSNGDLV